MRLIVIVLVALSIPVSLHAQEKDVGKKVDKLVEALASSDDRIKAYSELQKLGPPAYPHLFKHFSDERHSIREDGGSAMRDWTVGQMCYHVIELQLQPYKTFTEGGFDPRSRKRRPDYAKHINLRDPKAANQWWETRKKWSLHEFQVEALEWVVDEERNDQESFLEVERNAMTEALRKLKATKKPLKPGVPWVL